MCERGLVDVVVVAVVVVAVVVVTVLVVAVFVVVPVVPVVLDSPCVCERVRARDEEAHQILCLLACLLVCLLACLLACLLLACVRSRLLVCLLLACFLLASIRAFEMAPPLSDVAIHLPTAPSLAFIITYQCSLNGTHSLTNGSFIGTRYHASTGTVAGSKTERNSPPPLLSS
jgi:hypothetical protein